MANDQSAGWEELRVKVKAPCPGCPRNSSKMPVMFPRQGLGKVDFVVLSQEPGHWLKDLGGDGATTRLQALSRDGGSTEDVRRANPLIKVAQLFDRFDPAAGRVYWTHALKCVPTESDRAINKEWRKAATRCEEHFLEELKALGAEELNVVAFGKYALEMCLHLLEGQDIDQDISISEFMQSHKLPVPYKHRFKDGTSKTINLFVLTNPSSEVVKVMKSGGKMTVEEIQDLEAKRIRDILAAKKR